MRERCASPAASCAAIPIPPSATIGLVPQDLGLYEEMSAHENLHLFGALYGLDGAKLKRAMDEALDLVGLRDRAKDKVMDFSGGMKRRLNLAAALMHDPQLLLLDEPTVGVDPQSRNAIFDNLEALKKARQDAALHHALHGRGRAPVRPPGDYRPRKSDRRRYAARPPSHGARGQPAGDRARRRAR